MEEQNSNAYSEALAVLKLLDDEKKLEKLPIEMLEVLKAKANPAYMPEYSKEIPLDEQNLMPETLSILSWIAMKYWGEDISEESNSKQITETTEEHTLTEEKQEETTIEKQENIELNEEKDQQEKVKEKQTKDADSTLLVLYKDLKWYQKIKMKIIEFFNKIFKKHVIEEKNNEEKGNNL